MSTRSNIGMLMPDGTVRGIYCHFDGYPEHHVPLLTEHYATAERVAALIDLGDISTLDREIGDAHSFDSCPDGWCNAYGRDRGEKNVGADDYGSISEFDREANNDYAYLFTAGAWLGRAWDGPWMPVADLLAAERGG